jgi:hypothetical protein
VEGKKEGVKECARREEAAEGEKGVPVQISGLEFFHSFSSRV